MGGAAVEMIRDRGEDERTTPPRVAIGRAEYESDWSNGHALWREELKVVGGNCRWSSVSEGVLIKSSVDIRKPGQCAS